MSIKLLPYKTGSQSAKALALGLGIKRLKLVGSKWQGKADDTVINWGNSKGQPIGAAAILNNPVNVGVAANKLKAQKAFNGSPYCLPFSDDVALARRWIAAGEVVVCRTKLTGNSGEGIVIAEKPEEIVAAPLYTIYKKKTQEYRVHVFDGEVLSIQRKARKVDVPDEDVNWKVRNLDGGFIFARTGFDVPQEVVDAAKGAMRDLQLDFGAVDVGYHKKEGTFVYEVNTACGLDGSNLTDYIEAFCKKLNLPVPPRPEDYVAPTLPNVVQADDEIEIVDEVPKERAVVNNEQVIGMLNERGGDKVATIKALRQLGGFGLGVAKAMIDRAANTIAARKVLEEPKAPEPKVVHPLGSKENPLGEKVDGAVLRQVRPDLNVRDDNTNPRMVDEYAGKWGWFVERFPHIEYGFRIPNDNQWSWGESHLVPEGTYEIKLGNINKKLNEEQQAKLAAFVLQL